MSFFNRFILSLALGQRPRGLRRSSRPGLLFRRMRRGHIHPDQSRRARPPAGRGTNVPNAHGRSWATAKAIVDERPFVGTAVTVTSHVLAIEDVSPAVMKAIYHGDEATIIVGSLSWAPSIENAALAIDAWAGVDTAAQ